MDCGGVDIAHTCVFGGRIVLAYEEIILDNGMIIFRTIDHGRTQNMPMRKN